MDIYISICPNWIIITLLVIIRHFIGTLVVKLHMRPWHSTDSTGVEPRLQAQRGDRLATQTWNKHCFYVT